MKYVASKWNLGNSIPKPGSRWSIIFTSYCLRYEMVYDAYKRVWVCATELRMMRNNLYKWLVSVWTKYHGRFEKLSSRIDEKTLSIEDFPISRDSRGKVASLGL